ncbi:hypothetical protein AVEN_193749-1 [Araneus ventricosus]|uniref:TIL domain-containing protein n=1 Tax=Araneus ventricosus TaxID=182803 RepID=A0A4Y2DMQ7_ARAVE|nr:hypothetical protein AVEN_193749-1 [Araneus ventricosus]
MKALCLLLIVVLVNAAFAQSEQDCPPNKEFGSYGDCPPSCLKNPPNFCTMKLNYGCKCKKGYVLTRYRDYKSDCIKPEECPDES